MKHLKSVFILLLYCSLFLPTTASSQPKISEKNKPPSTEVEFLLDQVQEEIIVKKDMIQVSNDLRFFCENKRTELSRYKKSLLLIFDNWSDKKSFDEKYKIEEAIDQLRNTALNSNRLARQLYFINSNLRDSEYKSIEASLKVNALENKITAILPDNSSTIDYTTDPSPIDSLTLKSKKDVDQLKDKLTSTIDQLIELFSTESTALNNDVVSLKKELKKKSIEEHNLQLQLQQQNQQGNSIHSLAIRVGLPLFCLTVVLLFGISAYSNKKSSDTTTKSFQNKMLLDLITVLLLTMTILILGLSQQLKNEVLGTLLGGISGYILNRNMKSTAADSPP